MTRHSVQTDMLGLVTDTHRADDGQPTLEDALDACTTCGAATCVTDYQVRMHLGSGYDHAPTPQPRRADQ